MKLKFENFGYSNFMTSSNAYALNKKNFYWITWEVTRQGLPLYKKVCSSLHLNKPHPSLGYQPPVYRGVSTSWKITSHLLGESPTLKWTFYDHLLIGQSLLPENQNFLTSPWFWRFLRFKTRRVRLLNNYGVIEKHAILQVVKII